MEDETESMGGFTDEQEPDGNQIINPACSPKWWCDHGLKAEHVSQLNREYVVNIFKEPSL